MTDRVASLEEQVRLMSERQNELLRLTKSGNTDNTVVFLTQEAKVAKNIKEIALAGSAVCGFIAVVYKLVSGIKSASAN